jgi:hypothetical protein
MNAATRDDVRLCADEWSRHLLARNRRSFRSTTHADRPRARISRTHTRVRLFATLSRARTRSIEVDDGGRSSNESVNCSSTHRKRAQTATPRD